MGLFARQNALRTGVFFVHLAYPDSHFDDFEWQLFTTSEMLSLADSLGLDLIVACTDFDAAVRPGASKPRIQFVLERRGARTSNSLTREAVHQPLTASRTSVPF